MNIVYVNGAFIPSSEATISIFDRGFLFADSVYEVSAVINSKLVDFEAHMARLARSCEAIRIPFPGTQETLREAHLELLEQNKLTEGVIYLQVTRGTAERDFIIDPELSPNLVMFTQEKNILNNPKIETGMRVMTLPDERWARRDIKTTQLLTQSLAKSEAVAKGYDDGWFVQNGFVNEGTSNNVFIVTKDGTIQTRQPTPHILRGITRETIMDCATELGLEIIEKPFSIAEAQNAVEAFITSANTFAWPVVEIDDVQVGDGAPGQVFKMLRKLYLKRLE